MTQKQKGILLITASSFFFALMNLFVRLSGDLPAIQKSFFRNFVALIFAAILLFQERPKLKVKTTFIFACFIWYCGYSLQFLCG